jgi:hypothetical protein
MYSLSETALYPCRSSFPGKEDHQRLLQRVGRKLQRYVELESSNTCLGASTEFTPDFLLTTTNNSKYDNDDQTEQFGFDIQNHEDCNSEVAQGQLMLSRDRIGKSVC